MKPTLYKIETIGRGFLSIMAKPVSGEWINDEFLGIAQEGILQIVSLLDLKEEYEVGLQHEKKLAIENKMEFISYPIKDRGIPASVEQFSQLTKNLYQQIKIGKNTVIHCRAGIGRTGLVAGGVLLYCGFSAKDAFIHLSKQRKIQVPDTIEQENWLIENAEQILKFNPNARRNILD